MANGISVCHVVNSAGETSMPADLATTQATLDDITDVGMLAWFDIEPFRDIEQIEMTSLDVPDTLYITRDQYRRAKSVLEGYDIVHTHHPHSGFYGKLIAKRIGKPVIHTEHNNHDGFTQKGRVANGVTNFLTDAIVCVSESVRASFAQWEELIVTDQKVRVINNGVDIGRVNQARELKWSIYDQVDIDPEAVVVGSAGMLTEQKAHDVLIEAVDMANAECDQPIELVISGDGELREQLETQIAEADYTDRLHLLGFLEERDQVYKMMHEIDIYAMPSQWEGFCVAALEAMAVGNACVFSEIPEFKLPFEGVARFHDVNDSESLAGQLKSLIIDGGLKREEDAPRQLVLDNYTMERTANEYAHCYQKNIIKK